MTARDPQGNVKFLGDVVLTADGSLTLKDPGHGECYHSLMGATRESQELYVDASGLAQHWNQPHNRPHCPASVVTILDVGLGLGYNAVTTITTWLQAETPTSVVMQSLEIDPALVEALASGAASWQSNWQPDLLAVVRSLGEVLSPPPGTTWFTRVKHPRNPCTLEWYIHVADARLSDISPKHAQGWDYIWQDPFSPEKNPGMWTAEWFAKVRQGTHSDTILMTYSVARGVREALTTAGWHWDKFPSHSGMKRHWLRAKSCREPDSSH